MVTSRFVLSLCLNAGSPSLQITVTDSGPKLITLGTATSNGVKTFDIRVSWRHSGLAASLALT